MSPSTKAHLQIHFCVVLWGFTAILGKLITLDSLSLVWWRMLLVVLFLGLLPRVWRGWRALATGLRWQYAGIGVIVALHWLTFFGAIKLANASVAVTCIALATVFTALVEPLMTTTAFSRRDILLGIAVVPGVLLVVGGVPTEMHLGIVVGVISALLVAIFSAWNKRLVHDADPLTVTAIEIGAGTLALTVIAMLLLATGLQQPTSLLVLPEPRDLGYLLILSLGCTVLPFSLWLVALRHMSAYAAQLAINLEPVYTIVLAILLLGEQHDLSGGFYFGVVIILAAVLAGPLRAVMKRQVLSQPQI